MWQTLSWMVNSTASFLWETGKQIIRTGIAQLRPLSTLASLVVTEIIWHQALAPAVADYQLLGDNKPVKNVIPVIYYGLIISVYCAFHPQHLKGFARGLAQHLSPSGLIKAYQKFSAPIAHISRQTVLYIIMPAMVWHFAVHPSLRAVTPENHQWPVRLLQGMFWIAWQRPTRLLFSAGFNEYYHTSIAKGLYLNPNEEPVTVVPVDQTASFKELGRLIPIPAAHVMYHHARSKPIINKASGAAVLRQPAGKSQGMSDYIRIGLTLVKRLMGYVLLMGVTEVTPYINYFTPIMELLLRGVTLGYVDLDIVFTDTHAELLYVCMLAYLYSYATHEYYFSTMGHPATDQAIMMAENPAFHLAYGLPLAAAEYYLAMKGLAGLDSEIIYGLMFLYFPIMMIQAEESARKQHQRSSKADHWAYYLMPFYMPFHMAGRLVDKTIAWIVSAHKKQPAPVADNILAKRHTLHLGDARDAPSPAIVLIQQPVEAPTQPDRTPPDPIKKESAPLILTARRAAMLTQPVTLSQPPTQPVTLSQPPTQTVRTPAAAADFSEFSSEWVIVPDRKTGDGTKKLTMRI